MVISLSAGHRQHEDVAVHAADGAKLIAGDDCGGVAGQGRGIGSKVPQHRGAESARATPQCEPDQERHTVVRKAHGQQNDHNRTDDGADHAKPALAQRGPELRLAYQRGGRTCPVCVVELQPIRHKQSQCYRGPKPQTEQQRWRDGIPCHLGQPHTSDDPACAASHHNADPVMYDPVIASEAKQSPSGNRTNTCVRLLRFARNDI